LPVLSSKKMNMETLKNKMKGKTKLHFDDLVSNPWLTVLQVIVIVMLVSILFCCVLIPLYTLSNKYVLFFVHSTQVRGAND